MKNILVNKKKIQFWKRKISLNASEMSITNGDVRKQFLLTTIANYYSLPLKDEVITQLNENKKLNNFLDDGNSTLLSANIEKRSGGENRIILDNATHVGHTEDKESTKKHNSI